MTIAIAAGNYGTRIVAVGLEEAPPEHGADQKGLAEFGSLGERTANNHPRGNSCIP
jgi:hypothetical protein